MQIIPDNDPPFDHWQHLHTAIRCREVIVIGEVKTGIFKPTLHIVAYAPHSDGVALCTIRGLELTTQFRRAYWEHHASDVQECRPRLTSALALLISSRAIGDRIALKIINRYKVPLADVLSVTANAVATG